MPVDTLLVFHTTNLSMTGEKVLRAAGVDFQVLPLPKEIIAGCSLAIEIGEAALPQAKAALDEANVPLEAVYSRVGDRWETPTDQATPSRKKTCRIYLDNNATTPPDPEVVRALAAQLGENFGNPSSVHSAGRQARQALEKARAAVSALIGADPSEIVFTSGGTESNALALSGVLSAHSDRGDHIITTKTEHSSILQVCRHLESSGIRVTYLPVDSDGLVDPENIRQAIDRRTVLVSIAWANSETGVIQPIQEIAEIARQNRILLHTDAVQAVGKIPVDVQAAGVDLLSLSAHKFHGLKGVGALYIRKAISVVPLLHGGGQEGGLRSGTENVPGIVGMGMAAGIARRQLEHSPPRQQELRDILSREIRDEFPWVTINGHVSQRLPNTLNLCFQNIRGEEMVAFLDKEGICVSTGSACGEGEPEPSHVLMAMGLTDEQARSSVRFSLGRDTADDDVRKAVAAVTKVVRRYG
jgi:cysteine desulfurase